MDGQLETPNATGFERPRKGFPWGCLIGGCLVVCLLIVGGVAAVGWGTYAFYKRQIKQYTSESPRELPVVELSQEELTQIEQRVQDFQNKVEEGESPEQLVLTADDINALISHEEKLKGRVFVTIADGKINAEVSFPTDSIPGAKGRFFNGSASINASLEDGVLVVTVDQAEVNGEAVPESLMSGIRKENLAKDVAKDPEVAETIAKFESLEIQEDRIVLTAKSPNADAGTSETNLPPEADADQQSAESPQVDRAPIETPPTETPPTETPPVKDPPRENLIPDSSIPDFG